MNQTNVQEGKEKVSLPNATGNSQIMGGNDDGRRIAFTILNSISMFFAIFGNLFVIFVVFKKRSMKTSTNMMLANLAVADLLVGCTIMPFEIAVLNGAGGWVGGLFGDISCKIFFFVSHTTIASSIVTLTLMALDRFLAIMFTLKQIRIFDNAKLTTGIIWISSMAIMVPILPASEPIARNGRYICFRGFKIFGDYARAQKIYYLLLFFLLYLIPLLFMAIIFALIIRKLWFQKVPGNTTDNNQRLAQERKRNVIRLLVVIVITFALCWFPAHVVHYYWSYRDQDLPTLPLLAVSISFWFSQANSSINPCLYIGLSSEFRKAFLQFLNGQRQFFLRSSFTNHSQATATMRLVSRRQNGVGPEDN